MIPIEVELPESYIAGLLELVNRRDYRNIDEAASDAVKRFLLNKHPNRYTPPHAAYPTKRGYTFEKKDPPAKKLTQEDWLKQRLQNSD